MSSEAPTLRRNGRTSACEPCRRGKLACDHTRPKCQRCLARSRDCWYHAAPMKGQGKKARLAREAAASAAAKESARNEAVQSPSIQVSADNPFTKRLPALDNHPAEKNAYARSSTGFLGEMSYLSTLSESHRDVTGLPTDEASEDTVKLSHDASHLAEGVKVLKALWRLVKIENLNTSLRAGFGSLTPDPILQIICFSLKGIFENNVQGPPDDKKLRNLASMISDNTSKRLKPPGRMSMAEYATTFVGPKLRWEALGLLFARFALRASPLGTAGIFVSDLSHHEAWKSLIEAATSCLSLCDSLLAINDLVWFTTDELYVTLTLFHGDSSYPPWKCLGDLSSILYALGLHQDIDCSAEVPRWLVETRKLARLHAFWADITMCCFTGRPPRISSRYCSMQRPYALTFEQLELPPDELDQVVASLGDKIHHITSVSEFPAAIAIDHPFMLIREKILELFLCRQVGQDEAEQCLAELEATLTREQNGLPERFRYHDRIWESGISIGECYHILMLSLDIKYNFFLVERYRVQRLHANTDELLRLSSDLLTSGLVVISLREKHGSGYTDVPWMLALYCLPPAGVLALELLRAAQNRCPSSRAIPRSKVIQNLSVLAGALDWVATPGVGNFALCQQARKMLLKIIDVILDPPYDDKANVMSFNNVAQYTPTSSTGFSNQDMAWLGNTDPSEELWANLENTSLLMFDSTGNNYWH